VPSPVEPDAHAVVVDLLFVADQNTGTLAAAGEFGDERDIHLLAARLQFLADADDGVQALAHVGREQVLANVFAIDLLGVLDELVVGVNCSESHVSYPSRWRPPNKKPASLGGWFSLSC